MNSLQHSIRPAGPAARVAAAARPQTARAMILVAAVISFVLSVSLWFAGYREEGLFVGIWVPTIISLGAFLVPRRAEP
jgi:hypothetical protein